MRLGEDTDRQSHRCRPLLSLPRLALKWAASAKSFGGVAVLSNVDLTVAPGEVIALLGSNGAGKSTLVKILTGVYARDAGRRPH